MSASNWHHLFFQEILRVTEKAILVLLEDGDEIWLPLSQVEPGDYRAGDQDGSLCITEWIAKEKGLI
jgi:hypothetical protein